VIKRLRWHLHEIDPGWEPKARSLDRRRAYDAVDEHLTLQPQIVIGSDCRCQTVGAGSKERRYSRAWFEASRMA
jgi:hypothetical protein